MLLSIVLTRLKDRQVIAVFARDITDQLKAENDLKQKLDELEQFNLLVVGREEKMIGLKEEINGPPGGTGPGGEIRDCAVNTLF